MFDRSAPKYTDHASIPRGHGKLVNRLRGLVRYFSNPTLDQEESENFKSKSNSTHWVMPEIDTEATKQSRNEKNTRNTKKFLDRVFFKNPNRAGSSDGNKAATMPIDSEMKSSSILRIPRWHIRSRTPLEHASNLSSLESPMDCPAETVDEFTLSQLARETQTELTFNPSAFFPYEEDQNQQNWNKILPSDNYSIFATSSIGVNEYDKSLLNDSQSPWSSHMGPRGPTKNKFKWYTRRVCKTEGQSSRCCTLDSVMTSKHQDSIPDFEMPTSAYTMSRFDKLDDVSSSYIELLDHHKPRHTSINSMLTECGPCPAPNSTAYTTTVNTRVAVSPWPRRSASLVRHATSSSSGESAKLTATEAQRMQRHSQFGAVDGYSAISEQQDPVSVVLDGVICERKSMGMSKTGVSGGRKILNFLQRGFQTKRPKSTSKVEHRKSSHGMPSPGCQEDPTGSRSMKDKSLFEASPREAMEILDKQITMPKSLLDTFPARIRPISASAPELMPTSPHSLVYPIDASLVGRNQRYCFQVISSVPDLPIERDEHFTSHTTAPRPHLSPVSEDQKKSYRRSHVPKYRGQRIYSTSSIIERDRWILCLKRLTRPDLDAERRRENCLHIWIQEAKGLTGSHRYHCEILLDGQVYARTNSKQHTDMLFWGEEFDLSGLPDFSTLSVQLWLDRSSANGSRNRAFSSPHLSTRNYPTTNSSPPRMRRAMMMSACTRGSLLDGSGSKTDEEEESSDVVKITPEAASVGNANLYESRSRKTTNLNAYNNGVVNGTRSSSPSKCVCSGPVGRKVASKRDAGKTGRHKASHMVNDGESSFLMATVTIPHSQLGNVSEVENWYPATCASTSPLANGRARREDPHELTGMKTRSSKSASSLPASQQPGTQLRIKTRHRTVTVLPLLSYTRLKKQLETFQTPMMPSEVNDATQTVDAALLLSSLDPWLGVKAKAELAGSVVAFQQACGQATEFLAVLVVHEVIKQADPNMVLRGNSIATKATEIYLRLVGETYLSSTLSDFVGTVLNEFHKSGTIDNTSSTTTSRTNGTAAAAKQSRREAPAYLDCEVDTARLAGGGNSGLLLARNQKNLLQLVRMVWDRILDSESFFPSELRSLFTTIRQHLSTVGWSEHPQKSKTQAPSSNSNVNNQTGGASLAEHVISACLFLRYICPAILSPSLFGLAKEFPSDTRILRAFTLVAKTIQTLANFSLFAGAKEVYMTFMNPFVKGQLPAMRHFLHAVSSPVPSTWHEIHEPAGTDETQSRVLASQSHHAGFAEASWNGNAADAGSTWNECSILTRSFSGLPTCSSSGVAGTLTDRTAALTRVDGTVDSSDVHRQIPNGDESITYREPLRLPSLPVPQTEANGNGDHIDLPLCLALCHIQLSEAIGKIPTDKMIPLVVSLRPLLEEITYFLQSGFDPTSTSWWRGNSMDNTNGSHSGSSEYKRSSNVLLEKNVPMHSGDASPCITLSSNSNGSNDHVVAKTAVRSRSSGCLNPVLIIQDSINGQHGLCSTVKETVTKQRQQLDTSASGVGNFPAWLPTTTSYGVSPLNRSQTAIVEESSRNVSTAAVNGDPNTKNYPIRLPVSHRAPCDASTIDNHENIDPTRNSSIGITNSPSNNKVAYSKVTASIQSSPHYIGQTSSYTVNPRSRPMCQPTEVGPSQSEAVTTMEDSLKLPSEDSTLWSIGTESHSDLTNPQTDPSQFALHQPHQNYQPTILYPGQNERKPIGGYLGTGQSNSSGYQSLNSHEAGYHAIYVGPSNTQTLQRGLGNDTIPAMNNPLYAFHSTVYTHGLEPSSPSRISTIPGRGQEAEEEELPAVASAHPVHASPHRSKSFQNSPHAGPRRHTYVNLSPANGLTDEALMSIRIKQHPIPQQFSRRRSRGTSSGSSADSSPVNSRASMEVLDRRSTLVCSDTDLANLLEASNPLLDDDVSDGSIPRHTSECTEQEATRRVTTLHAVLEGYNGMAQSPTSYYGGTPMNGVRRATCALPTESRDLQPELKESIVPSMIRNELDASQARLAEAQARLLANEAERIQLLRTWHNELMRQSQLVGRNSDGGGADGSINSGPAGPLSSGGESLDRGTASRGRSLDDTMGGTVASSRTNTDQLQQQHQSRQTGHQDWTAFQNPTTTPVTYAATVHRTPRTTPHSSQPRMGATALGSSTMHAPDSTTDKYRQSTWTARDYYQSPRQTHAPIPSWLIDCNESSAGGSLPTDPRVTLARSPSSPGLDSRSSGQSANIRLLAVDIAEQQQPSNKSNPGQNNPPEHVYDQPAVSDRRRSD